MMESLGVDVPTDALGPLQDVHWSMGKCDDYIEIHECNENYDNDEDYIIVVYCISVLYKMCTGA